MQNVHFLVEVFRHLLCLVPNVMLRYFLHKQYVKSLSLTLMALSQKLLQVIVSVYIYFCSYYSFSVVQISQTFVELSLNSLFNFEISPVCSV